ncbi:uncharacterized protein LOC121640324 [Melanotaenia boesemani]|uniref:uncharacterized protein LOC121640324 n=1 Tax=Melanotaenia boesemani TaxID=1250792 RepID=UPI001C045B22|nr:uncharacterized protein LOC121640324 [Melanotaenia boesemani]
MFKSTMAEITPVRLLVYLNEDNNVRMELRKGIPYSLEELIDEVKNACGLEGCIRLQYKDTDFGNIFVNLTSTAVIKDLSILKVIQLDPNSTTVILYPVDLATSSNSSFSVDSDESSVSARTDDTVLLSSPSSDSLRTQQWPQVFQIPCFSYDTECQLQRANAEYMKDQTRLTPSSKMLSDILEKVAESIYAFTPYPEDCHYSDVAEALTRKHPCLREPGSFNMSYGWKHRLKMKMGNYRTQLKAHGTAAELTVNSIKSKTPGDTYPARNVKRPRRAEVNHFPSLPCGETTDSLEQERISLLSEMLKRNNRQTIKEKMAKTFGYCRQEIVHKQPSIEDILTRWPALFRMEEINAEFLRVTAVPLETKFLAQLDKHSTKLLEVIRSKGGRVKEQTTNTLKALDETIDITIRRECTLKSLMIYLGEPVHHLIKEYQDLQENEADVLEQETMAIFVPGKEDSFHSPKDIKIVIDGTPVLNEVPSVATAVAMLFGLTYALNLRYPKNLQYTLEFVQKVLMELGGKKMSKKVYRLSSQLYSPE